METEFIDKIPIDRNLVEQDKLDVNNRDRTNLFNWRGQFSPGLIDVLLDKFAKSNSVVFDPFVGSGTTLFESARRSIEAYGSELNPAAVEMASTIKFVNMPISKRVEYITKAEEMLKKYNTNDIKHLIKETDNILIRNILVNSAINHFNISKNKNRNGFNEAFSKHSKIIMNLPYVKKRLDVFHSDARHTELKDNSIDLIITSPPYINVFNYHQNYRPVMEKLGWDLLSIARSEFGSNRKNRSNRFLTVVQYSIDMNDVLKEMNRITKSNGRIIIVIGRESKIRGVSFENYKIITALACKCLSMKLLLRQERSFKNKFGKTIYEDILHFKPQKGNYNDKHSPIQIAKHFLREAMNDASDKSLKNDILEAVKKAEKVQPSPIFKGFVD